MLSNIRSVARQALLRPLSPLAVIALLSPSFAGGGTLPPLLPTMFGSQAPRCDQPRLTSSQPPREVGWHSFRPIP